MSGFDFRNIGIALPQMVSQANRKRLRCIGVTDSTKDQLGCVDGAACIDKDL